MFTFIRNLVAANKKTLKNNVGATMIEYALVVAAIVGIGGYWFVSSTNGDVAATGISGAINTKMDAVADGITGETATDTTLP
jgi:Flp pilus assembly pilin Flp